MLLLSRACMAGTSPGRASRRAARSAPRPGTRGRSARAPTWRPGPAAAARQGEHGDGEPKTREKLPESTQECFTHSPRSGPKDLEQVQKSRRHVYSRSRGPPSSGGCRRPVWNRFEPSWPVRRSPVLADSRECSGRRRDGFPCSSSGATYATRPRRHLQGAGLC